MNIVQDLSSSHCILELLSQNEVTTPIYHIDDLIIRYANDAMIAFWGNDRSNISKTFEETVLELQGQPSKKMLQNLSKTDIFGRGIMPATTLVNGRSKTRIVMPI
ncbi:MAG: hypothetical protein M3O71_25520 [Bacteroidota bacterium]|nr:hypothetical protein [Bacteroidota bacterium]